MRRVVVSGAGAAPVTWPVEFPPGVRALIAARDTPPGMGAPRCVVCGLAVPAGDVRIHHILFRSRGGDGRASNGLVVCGAEQGEGCHATRIHDDPQAGFECAGCGWKTPRWAGRCFRCQAWGTVARDCATAAACGWARSRHAPVPLVYRAPVLCAWRGWIVLTDRPCKENMGLYWRPAAAGDMGGDYDGSGDG